MSVEPEGRVRDVAHAGEIELQVAVAGDIGSVRLDLKVGGRAEVAVGLAILVMIYRNIKSVDINMLNKIKW